MSHIYGLDQTGMQVAADAAKVAKEVAARYASEVDEKGRFPKEAIDALGRQGLMGLCLPSNVGGKGQGPRAFVAVVEELAQACASTAMVYVMHVSAAQVIAAAGALEGRAELLKDIASGRHLTTLALSEKGSRSNFWLPVSRLEPKNGGFVTSASKSWVTAASNANSYVSSAQKDQAKTPLESVVYLARTGNSAIRVDVPFNGLGLRGNDSAPVTLSGHAVHRSDFLCDEGAGLKTMLEVVLPWFAIGTAAMANGLCRAAVAATAAHLSGTTLQAPGGSLRDLPNLRARLAQMSVRTEQARALLAYTLSLMEKPTDITPLYVLQTRLASLEAAIDVTDLAMKTCGGAAFSRHFQLDRIFRDARAGWVMAPTVDHLNDFIGKALTGLPLV